MSHADPRLILVEYCLCLFIERSAFLRVHCFTRLIDQLLEIGVAPAGVVLAVFRRFTAQHRSQEVIRVAIVACPAGRHHVMFAILGTFEHFTPFHDANIDLDADLCQVGLHHLRAEHRVGVGRATAVAGEQGKRGAFRHTGFLQQGACLVEVDRRVLQAVVVTQQGRRIGVDRYQRIALAEHRVDISVLVECHVNGFADPHVAQILVGRVDRDVAGGHCLQLIDFQIRVFLDAWHVVRLRVQRDLTFVGLELLQAHVVVGGDGQNQGIGRRLAAEVVRVGLEAYLRILGVALEDEGAGADWLAVEVAGLVGFQQLVGVFSRIDRSKSHREVGQEWRFAAGQGELDGVVVSFLDAFQQLFEAHAFKVGEADTRFVMPRVLRVQLTLKTPEHVIGVHVTGRFEVIGGVEFDAFTQVEGVRQAVVADLPGLSQRRDHFRGAGFEIREAVEHGFSHGIGRYCCRVLHHVEAFGAGFGADHQGFCRNTDGDAEQGQGDRVA